MSVPKILSTVLVTTTKPEEETERMLTMPEINYIKHLRENEDLSISEIARKVGKDWKTVKKVTTQLPHGGFFSSTSLICTFCVNTRYIKQGDNMK